MAAKKRILIVDDDPMLRDLIRSLLEEQGYAVGSANGGEEGLAAIQADPPDLVLLDLKMPGLDGWGVIERLKSHPAPPILIVMSGMGLQEPPGLRTVSSFVCGYLAKPFNPDLLIKTCARALAAAALGASAAEAAHKDRRREARRNLLVPAALLTPEGTPAALGQILNLSPSGAQFDLGGPLQPGADVTLAFEIPGGHGPFQVTGRIQWKREGKIGLAFTEMSDEDKKRLGRLLGEDA